MGSFRPGAGNQHLHWYFNFTGCIVETGWSKAPWGLSVLARVTSIFTGISISPGALLRQRSNHYAFRAGRNLPDKEFHWYFNFTGCIVETALKSLRLSCGSELTRQGISLP